MNTTRFRMSADCGLDFDLHDLRASRTSTRLASHDTFEGVVTDPTSLHKYLYAGANPVRNVDPSGHDFSLTSMVVTAGITGIVSASLVGAYGYAKGWSAGQIAKAATYAFFIGAIGGAAAYGVAWGLAAGAAISSGLVAAEAGAFSSVGWTAVGLMTTPTTLGLAIGNFIQTENDPNADATDRWFARANLAISAFVFLGVHAQAISVVRGIPVPLGAGPELTNKINEIKALPPNQQLTAEQLAALRSNVNLLKGVVSRNHNTQEIADRVSNIIRTDPRFTNLSPAQRDAFVAEVQNMVKN